MKKKLYLAVSNKLKQDTSLLWVAWQQGQFMRRAKQQTVPLPAALIDIEKLTWEDANMGQQEGTLTLSVEIYMSAYGAPEDTSEMHQDTLQALDLLHAVAISLQNCESEGVQGLSRTQEERLYLPEEPHLIAYKLLFQSRVQECLKDNTITKYQPSKWKVYGQISNQR